MKILLDTHVWLWMQVEPEKIAEASRELLADSSNLLFLSAASSWEIAIKWSLGKLPLPEPPTLYVPKAMVRHGVQAIEVEHRHTLAVAGLPTHHGDPFDRLLIAQAQLEGMTLATADRLLAPYDVAKIWA